MNIDVLLHMKLHSKPSQFKNFTRLLVHPFTVHPFQTNYYLFNFIYYTFVLNFSIKITKRIICHFHVVRPVVTFSSCSFCQNVQRTISVSGHSFSFRGEVRKEKTKQNNSSNLNRLFSFILFALVVRLILSIFLLSPKPNTYIVV